MHPVLVRLVVLKEGTSYCFLYSVQFQCDHCSQLFSREGYQMIDNGYVASFSGQTAGDGIMLSFTVCLFCTSDKS